MVSRFKECIVAKVIATFCPHQAKILAFVSSPSQEKLLQLGEMRTQLQHQVRK